MNHKIAKIAIASAMTFSMQVSTMSQIFASENTNVIETLAASSVINVQATLQNAGNISNASMAAGALKNDASLEVIDGMMYVTVEFQTLEFAGLKGNASSIQYFVGSVSDANLNTPRNVTYRDYEGTQVEKTIQVPITANSKGTYGTYIHMEIDAMKQFMPNGVDAYIEVDVQAKIKEQLVSAIADAKTYVADTYTNISYTTLQNAITSAQSAVDNNADADTLTTNLSALNDAIAGLEVKQTVFSLTDGVYSIDTNVFKEDGVSVSMAAQAVKGASIQVENGVTTVDLQLGAVSVYGQTAYIDKVEIENEETGSWNIAEVTSYDEAGNVSGARFVLPKNIEKTNVKFYYGGSTRGSQAILYLGLANAQKVQTSVFASDGTYEVSIALWNATSDQASMAASAIGETATITVEHGIPTMYVSSKKMTMGTITAYLQELKVKHGDAYTDAEIIAEDKEGNPAIFAFALPSEDAMFDVLVNPHVTIMGNQDIPARIKVDYSTLEKVSDEIKAPSYSEETTPEQGTTTPNQGTTPDEGITTPSQGTTSSGSNISTTTPSVTTATSKNVATGDYTQLGLFGGLLILSGGIGCIAYRRKSCKS